MFRPKFDPFIAIWVIPDQNKNISLHKTDCFIVLSDYLLEVHSAAATGLLTDPQTAGEIVSFRPLYVFFNK